MANFPRRLHVGADGEVAVPLPRANVTPVPEWVRNSEGRNEQTGRQAVDETGLPLWEIAAAIYVDSYGTPTPETVVLRLARATRPEVADFFPAADGWNRFADGGTK